MLGEVVDDATLTITDGDDVLVSMEVGNMAQVWKGRLDLTGGMV